MCCIAGCIACEAMSCCCSAAKGGAKCCGKAVPSVGGRVGYVLVFLVFSLLAWVLRGYAPALLSWLPSNALAAVCKTDDGNIAENCFSILTVYRVSFALALFHFVLGLCMIGVTKYNDCRTGVQEGGWLWKVLIILAVIIGSMWIPHGFFAVYGWVALVGAGFFILIQLMLLVDFAHSWAESWIEKYEEDQMEADGDQKWWWALLTSSIVLYCAAIAGTVLLFVWFVPTPACQLSSAVISMNIVFAVIIAALSCHPKIQEINPRSGLLQAAIVTAYSTYLIYSALMSNPDAECNPFWSDMVANDAQGNITIALGAVFTIAAVCYSAIRSAQQLDAEGEDSETRPLTAAVLDTGDGDGDGDEEAPDMGGDPDDRNVPYHYSRFHAIFVFGSCYVGMLMSDWSTVDPSNETVAADMGAGSLWVKIISSWLCLVFYIWTLVAPLVLSGRDFS
jgi:serine incorporator 1